MNAIAENFAEDEVLYPSLVKRVQSIFIDTMLIIIAMVIISAVLNNINGTPDWVRVALFVFLFGVYEPTFIAFTNGTIGNRLMGLQVKQFNVEGKRLNIIQSYVRFIAKLLLGWLSFLTVHANAQKRAMHDMVCNSVMTKK